MGEFFQSRNAVLTPDRQAELAKMIQDANAYNHQYSYGPFDPLPQSAVGVEMIETKINQEIEDLTKGASELLQRASEAGWSQEELLPLHAYYSNSIAHRELTLVNLRKPPKNEDIGERIQRKRAKAQQERR